MELEQLNKSQIVLLTLLVSFVTSIATGIVTVSLMEQAPADVTRVVQRTVERTVEKVTPAEIQTKIVTQEKTVIVSESDLIASAVKRNTPSVVRIYIGREDATFIAMGVVISAQGIVATDAKALPDGVETFTVAAGEEAYTAEILRHGGERQIALLTLTDTEMVPRPAGLSDTRTALGRSVVLLTGAEDIVVGQGIVTELGAGAFGTNLSADKVLPGSVLVDTDGNVVGLSTGASRELGVNWFVPAHSILAKLSSPEQDDETSNATTTSQQAAAASALREETEPTETDGETQAGE